MPVNRAPSGGGVDPVTGKAVVGGRFMNDPTAPPTSLAVPPRLWLPPVTEVDGRGLRGVMARFAETETRPRTVELPVPGPGAAGFRAQRQAQRQLEEMATRFVSRHGRHPVVGLDLDGTTAGFAEELRRRLAAEQGLTAGEALVRYPDPQEYLYWEGEGAWFGSAQEFTAALRRFEADGLYQSMPAYEGAGQVLRALHATGFTVHVVTARESRWNADTKAWVAAHGLPITRVHNAGLDKHTVAMVDVFVEDHPGIVETLVDNDRRVIVLGQPYNADVVPVGTVRVTEWELPQFAAALDRLLG